MDMAYDADTSDQTGQHWAANKDPKKVAEVVAEYVKEYYDTLSGGGFLELYRLTHQAFYGLDDSHSHTSSRVVAFGEDGEKLGVRSNQLRSLVKYTYMSATQAPPAIKPRATNASPKALAQVPIARKVLEYYDRIADVPRALKGAALRSLLYGKGYVWQCWDMSIGPAGPDGRATGDLVVRAASNVDMACDLDAEGGKSDWYCARVRRVKYDLVAMHATIPEGADPEMTARAADLRTQIMDADSDFLDSSVVSSLQFWNRAKNRKSQDMYTHEYHFMHRKTPAVPNGRYIIMLSPEVILFDGALPYKDLTVDVMLPEEFLEVGNVGYASAWDLLGMQDIYDAAMSICATNMDAFGHNDILLPDGIEVGYEELRDGLNIIRYPLGEMNKPEMLEKFSLDESFFKYKDWLKGDMELVSGVNSVARGEPEKSLESGAALALVQAQAIQAQNPFVQAYQDLIARSGTTRIQILQAHLPQDRVLAISGSDDPESIRDFTVADISQIDRVDCESVNPLFQTIAGKQNAGDKLLERGLIRSAAAYMQFMESGRLETVSEDYLRQDLFGRRVREALSKGPATQQKPGEPDPLTGMPGEPILFVPEVRYLLTDDPRICIAAASSVLDSFENRNDPKIQEACLAYLSEVIRVWTATDPAVLTLLGYPLPTPAGMPGDPAAAGGAPEGGPKPSGPKPGGPKPGGPEPAEKPVDQKAPPEGSSMPSLPQPAENPL